MDYSLLYLCINKTIMNADMLSSKTHIKSLGHCLPDFKPDILNITLGFSLVMNPRRDQPVSGQQK